MTDQESTHLTLSQDDARQLERQREIKKCLIELHSNNPHHRSGAARRLGELRAGAEALLEALNDPNGFVRSASAEALGHAVSEPLPEVVEALLSAIDDSNDYVCAAAINSLGLLRSREVTDQLLPCLEDRNPLVVQATILALARIAPPGIEESLVPFLESDQYVVHLAATRAVGLLEYAPAGDSIRARLEGLIKDPNRQDLKLARLYIDTLVRLETRAAIPLLIEIARSEVGLRSAAVEALIELNAEEAAPILAPLLSDPSNKLRRYLVELMIRSNFRAALPFIRPMLKDPTITVRETALAAIGRWQDRASADTVRAMCHHDPNPFIRPQAINVLVDLIGDEAIPDLITLTSDVNVHVQRTAAYHLARARSLPPEGRAALARLAQNPELGESIQAALNAQPLIPEVPVEPVLALPTIPPSIQDHREFLLERLQAWQADLSTSSGELNLAEIARIDEALSTLIIALKRDSGSPEE